MHRFAAAILAACLSTAASAQECGDDQRLFDHDMLLGEPVCIPINPERIAFTMTEAIPGHIFGAAPVVKNWYSKSFVENYPNAVDATTFEGLVDLDYFPDSDPETLATANPDLIFASSYTADMNEKVADLAPLLVLDWTDPTIDWRNEQEFVAAALGAEAQEQALMVALNARIAQLRDDLNGQNPTFAVVRPTDEASAIQVFTELNFGAQILTQAGFQLGPDILPPDEAAKLNRAFWYKLSAERLQDLDVDYLVLLEGWEADIEAEWLTNPLWQTLPAVAEGRIITPHGDGQQYIRENVAYAHLVIDDVYRNVLGRDPADVNPNPFANWLPENIE